VHNIGKTAIQVSKRLVALRKKQLTLEDTVLETIKKGLQAKLNNEDEKNMNYYGFPNDFPEREVGTFEEIEVIALIQYCFVLNCFLTWLDCAVRGSGRTARKVRLPSAFRRE
jgi:hypothetical protein